MSLFARLFALRSSEKRQQEEDYFTEIVAAVLRARPDLFWLWLDLKEWDPYEPYDAIAVQTQVRRGQDSRIDLVFTRTRGDLRDIAYIESKLGSGEGDRQLARYAEHLSREPGDGRRLLVYATRDYDSKEEPPKLRTDVKWQPTRWLTFYRALLSIPSTDLTREILAFMEARHMSDTHTLTILDLVALNGAATSLNKLKETLTRSQKELKKIAGVDRSREIAMGQLLVHRRFVVHAPASAPIFGGQFDPDPPFAVVVGFWLDEPDGVPKACVQVELRGKVQDKDQATSVFQKWADVKDLGGDIWVRHYIGESYEAIRVSRPLTEVLGDNAVDDLVKWFRTHLNSLAEATPPAGMTQG